MSDTCTVTVPVPPLSLAFGQDTYQANIMGSADVSCTLKVNGSPVSGETVTFSYDMFGPYSETQTTDSNGVATCTVNIVEGAGTWPVTATYESATATCNVIWE